MENKSSTGLVTLLRLPLQNMKITDGCGSLGSGKAGAVTEGKDIGERVVLQGLPVDVHPAVRIYQGAGQDGVRSRHRGRDVQEPVLQHSVENDEAGHSREEEGGGGGGEERENLLLLEY